MTAVWPLIAASMRQVSPLGSVCISMTAGSADALSSIARIASKSPLPAASLRVETDPPPTPGHQDRSSTCGCVHAGRGTGHACCEPRVAHGGGACMGRMGDARRRLCIARRQASQPPDSGPGGLCVACIHGRLQHGSMAGARVHVGQHAICGACSAYTPCSRPQGSKRA
jgi:hypothetical protein